MLGRWCEGRTPAALWPCIIRSLLWSMALCSLLKIRFALNQAGFPGKRIQPIAIQPSSRLIVEESAVDVGDRIGAEEAACRYAAKSWRRARHRCP
jgi:hypothetical protein